MHLEVEINKEILDYEAQIASGLSLRKMVALISAIIISVIINLTIGKHMPQVLLMFVYVIAVLPSFVIGFVTYNGLVGEQVIVLLWKYFFSPKKLTTGCGNFYVKTQNYIRANAKGVAKEESNGD